MQTEKQIASMKQQQKQQPDTINKTTDPLLNHKNVQNHTNNMKTTIKSRLQGYNIA